MVQLRSVRLSEGDHPDRYPFSLPLVRGLGTLAFDSEVTILAGENGSGKSTLIEAIGLAADLPVVGGERAATDKTLAPLRSLARMLKLAWSRRTHRGFLFRAEDFFRFARRMNETSDELKAMRDEYAERFKDRPYARMLATGAMSGQIAAIEERYDGDLHARFLSGGFSFDSP